MLIYLLILFSHCDKVFFSFSRIINIPEAMLKKSKKFIGNSKFTRGNEGSLPFFVVFKLGLPIVSKYIFHRT